METTVQAPARVRQPVVAPAIRQEQWAVVGEVMAALGETGPRKGRVAHDFFWQIVALGGATPARELVREALVVVTGEGMATSDGARRRTAGGVWFRLAGKRLGHLGRAMKERAARSFEKRAHRKLAEVETTAAERADIERELVELDAALVERARATERRALMQAQKPPPAPVVKKPTAEEVKAAQKAEAKARRAAKKAAEKATGPACRCQEPGGVACPKHPGRVAAVPKPKGGPSCSKRPGPTEVWLGAATPPADWSPGMRPPCFGCGARPPEACKPQAEPLPMPEVQLRGPAVSPPTPRRAPVVEQRRPVEVEVVVARRRPVGGA